MKEVIMSPNAPKAIGPYVHGRVLNGVAYLSGQLGVDPSTGQLKESIEGQAEQAFSNIEEVLKSHGSNLRDIVKVTVMIADMNNFAAVNEIYEAKFEEPYPARSMFAVKELPRGAMLEIEVIADVSHIK